VGSQIHRISLASTRTPQRLKKSSPSGETRTGRQGAKYRVLSMGAKNATPRPPSVNASRTPWEVVTRKK
jgi:hypothetical protein